MQRQNANQNPATSERTNGIRPMAAKGAWDLVAYDVAQHATEYCGNHAHHHGNDSRHALGQSHLCAPGGKQAEPDSIRPLHRPFGGFEMGGAQEEHCRDAQQQQRSQPRRVLDPEERAPIKQYVAQGTAAEGGEPSRRANAYGIESLTCSLKQTLYRKREMAKASTIIRPSVRESGEDFDIAT